MWGTDLAGRNSLPSPALIHTANTITGRFLSLVHGSPSLRKGWDSPASPSCSERFSGNLEELRRDGDEGLVNSAGENKLLRPPSHAKVPPHTLPGTNLSPATAQTHLPFTSLPFTSAVV